MTGVGRRNNSMNYMQVILQNLMSLTFSDVIDILVSDLPACQAGARNEFYPHYSRCHYFDCRHVAVQYFAADDGKLFV